MASPAPSSDGVPASPLIVSYENGDSDPELREWVRSGMVAGIVVFQENARDEDHLAAVLKQLRSDAPGPLRIMIDEEGGPVRRLPDSAESMPSLRSQSGLSPEILAARYQALARRLTRIGIDTLLAPVTDIGGHTAGWLRERTFSDDPVRVAEMAGIIIPAVQKAGVHACAKHFPGTRSVVTDPHQGKAVDPTTPSEWEATDAVPFRAAIVAGADCVMVGHQHVMGFDPTRPACLSPLIIGGLLRQRLGFAGLVLSDDLAMGAIRQTCDIETAVRGALDAGCDLVLVCRNRELQRRAVASWTQAQTLPPGADR